MIFVLICLIYIHVFSFFWFLLDIVLHIGCLLPLSVFGGHVPLCSFWFSLIHIQRHLLLHSGSHAGLEDVKGKLKNIA